MPRAIIKGTVIGPVVTPPESNATETAIFWDGKCHKFGPVDVETFPKPDKFTDKWHFVSQDGRFDFTMTPFYDHHGDLNVLNLLRMHCHQVHGIWNGTAIRNRLRFTANEYAFGGA